MMGFYNRRKVLMYSRSISTLSKHSFRITLLIILIVFSIAIVLDLFIK
jgi:hypothetical protein